MTVIIRVKKKAKQRTQNNFKKQNSLKLQVFIKSIQFNRNHKNRKPNNKNKLKTDN